MHSGLCFCCRQRLYLSEKRHKGRRLKVAPAVGLASHLLGEDGPEQANGSVTGGWG